MRSPRAKRPRCHTCKGTGKLSVMVKPAGFVFPAEFSKVTCEVCGGTGIQPRKGA